jgi:hypothetical protein
MPAPKRQHRQAVESPRAERAWRRLEPQSSPDQHEQNRHNGGKRKSRHPLEDTNVSFQRRDFLFEIGSGHKPLAGRVREGLGCRFGLIVGKAARFEFSTNINVSNATALMNSAPGRQTEYVPIVSGRHDRRSRGVAIQTSRRLAMLYHSAYRSRPQSLDPSGGAQRSALMKLKGSRG